MSLLRVRHNLSPLVEKSLIAVALLAGLLAIYAAQALPFVAPVTWSVGTVPQPIPLDLDAWTPARNAAHSYVYAVPPGWIVDDAHPSVILVARDRGSLIVGLVGNVLKISVKPLGERRQVEDLAAADFAGLRRATYEISASGHPGLFVVAFENKMTGRQAAYVPRGSNVLVVRGDGVDPAVFSAFVSSIKFFTP